MHRTKTTAALLATVAVTTLSGCVSVGGGPEPVPAPRVPSAQPRAPHADSARPPRLVQAPAREALRLVGPAPRPTTPPYRPPAPTPTTRSAPAPPLAPAPAPSLSARRRTAPPRPAPPEPSAPPRPVATPTATDVCALGRAYGGWEPGGRMARLCARAYPGG